MRQPKASSTIAQISSSMVVSNAPTVDGSPSSECEALQFLLAGSAGLVCLGINLVFELEPPCSSVCVGVVAEG